MTLLGSSWCFSKWEDPFENHLGRLIQIRVAALIRQVVRTLMERTMRSRLGDCRLQLGGSQSQASQIRRTEQVKFGNRFHYNMYTCFLSTHNRPTPNVFSKICVPILSKNNQAPTDRRDPQSSN